jgi:hypothetical protein
VATKEPKLTDLIGFEEALGVSVFVIGNEDPLLLGLAVYSFYQELIVGVDDVDRKIPDIVPVFGRDHGSQHEIAGTEGGLHAVAIDLEVAPYGTGRINAGWQRIFFQGIQIIHVLITFHITGLGLDADEGHHEDRGLVFLFPSL